MNFCTEADCEEFFRPVPEFEKMLVRLGNVLIKYWFSITDDEQQISFHDADSGSPKAMEAQPDGR